MALGKIKFTIDNTKVNSILTDFPVMVQLFSFIGTGTYNGTQIFIDLTSNW